MTVPSAATRIRNYGEYAGIGGCIVNLINRAKQILFSPATEWEVIRQESLSTADLFGKYAVYVAAIPAAAGFLGRSLVGYPMLGMGVYRTPFFNGIAFALLSYLLSLAGVYLLGYIIDALATSFGAQKDMNASLKVAVFASTASWVAGVFQIIPALSILSILGLYSFYLMYTGIRAIKQPPPDKLVGYFVVTIIVAFVIYIVIGIIVGAIALGGIAAGSAF